MKRIVCFGPGPKFKGGISNYNTSLAKAFDKLGCEVHIVSWTQQYPAIIPREFVDKTSKTDLLSGTNIQVHYLTNYNNPFTWQQTVNLIHTLKPDIVVFQWAIAVQGLPLGYIARRLAHYKNIEIVFDLHFVVQKENSNLDKLFTRIGIAPAKTYVVHAYKTADELKKLYPNQPFFVNEQGVRTSNAHEKTIIKLYHPIYDLFKADPQFDVAAFKQTHHIQQHAFLFFGFIRKYKGLHNALRAFKIVADQRPDVSLLVCGESFWQTLDQTKLTTRIKNTLFGLAKKLFLKTQDDERNYNPLALIDELGIENKVFVKNEFIANEDVHKYFQASDCVLLFYEYATPSGVESLTYNFQMPLIATRVGHFPETIADGYNGYLANPDDVSDMANRMLYFLENPINRANVAQKAQTMSWENYANAILGNLVK